MTETTSVPPRWDAAYDRLSAELDRPALVLRARVFASRRSLDEQLADSESPLRTPALALRARQLVSWASREELAASLERLVREAEALPSPATTVMRLPRREILEARRCLLELATRLRADRPVYARGVAMLTRLLSDGAGPAYNPHAGCSLRDALRLAAEALDGSWPGGSA